MTFTLSENGSLIFLVDQIYIELSLTQTYIELSLTQTWTCNGTNSEMRAFYRSKYTDEAIQSQFYHINLDSNSGVHFF